MAHMHKGRAFGCVFFLRMYPALYMYKMYPHWRFFYVQANARPPSINLILQYTVCHTSKISSPCTSSFSRGKKTTVKYIIIREILFNSRPVVVCTYSGKNSSTNVILFNALVHPVHALPTLFGYKKKFNSFYFLRYTAQQRRHVQRIEYAGKHRCDLFRPCKESFLRYGTFNVPYLPTYFGTYSVFVCTMSPTFNLFINEYLRASRMYSLTKYSRLELCIADLLDKPLIFNWNKGTFFHRNTKVEKTRRKINCWIWWNLYDGLWNYFESGYVHFGKLENTREDLLSFTAGIPKLLKNLINRLLEFFSF